MGIDLQWLSGTLLLAVKSFLKGNLGFWIIVYCVHALFMALLLICFYLSGFGFGTHCKSKVVIYENKILTEMS